MFCATIVVFSCLYSCTSAQQLTQPPSVSVSSGSTVRLQCTLSYGYKSNIFRIRFCQQKPGSAPLFLYHFYNRNDQGRGAGSPSKFSVTADHPRNLWELVISGVQPEDEADYYCMIWRANSRLHIFGGGTRLNILTGEVKPPKVSIFLPSEEQITSDETTLVCLLSDFTPKSVTVKWLVDGQEQNESVTTTEVGKQSDNLYMESSFLTMPTSEWKTHELYACKVTHEGKDIVQTLKRSECA
ncbi:immunoglobulin lambda-like polypeptide 1 [Bombina bombina]|uniref:immunoglobulin lambda-like polypeptide 1 n=1 Tax=Bombina bombina TaxID=8345 RepID=UPI00235A61CC|nr:immunoglobulin lambda-like polypeptide 1 [Bombina bombina]